MRVNYLQVWGFFNPLQCIGTYLHTSVFFKNKRAENCYAK